MKELLLRMLATSFRRYIHHCSFKKLEHGLLHPFSGDIPCDGRIVALACDLIYLVNEDDASLRLCNIEIRLLKKTGQNAFHILSHISCLCQHCCIHNGERNVKQACYRFSHQGLARTGRTHHQDV